MFSVLAEDGISKSTAVLQFQFTFQRKSVLLGGSNYFYYGLLSFGTESNYGWQLIRFMFASDLLHPDNLLHLPKPHQPQPSNALIHGGTYQTRLAGKILNSHEEIDLW